jgi:hypothetical protein
MVAPIECQIVRRDVFGMEIFEFSGFSIVTADMQHLQREALIVWFESHFG